MIEGAAEAVRKLQELGKRVLFLTNNATKSRADYAAKMLDLGFSVEPEQIIGSAFAASKLLQKLQVAGDVYVVGEVCG